jgi:hypothetical protein
MQRPRREIASMTSGLEMKANISARRQLAKITLLMHAT